MNSIKKLIVTETIRYEFEVPVSMLEDEMSLKRFFAKRNDPWREGDFATVMERDFKIEHTEELLPIASKVGSLQAG